MRSTLLEYRYQLIGFGLASCFIGLTVVLGAVGSHIVTGYFPENLASYQLAVHYAELHGVALCLLFLAAHKCPRSVLLLTTFFFLIGLAGFSGVLVLKTLDLVAPPRFVIPAGGLSYIMGWLVLGIGMILSGLRTSREAESQ